ncbi:MAG: hypothetical protein H0U53_10565, partial [Actinobacteria bacterium]|nr:hypothetical protein [Actinomycetota bacterium]
SATSAGLGAVLIATAAGAGRMTGDPFRASLVALTPLTVGFAAIGLAAEEALTRAALAESNQVGWAVVALLFPLALTACLWAGISAGRSTGFRPPDQVRVTALALLGAILLLVVASPVSGDGTGLLFLVAFIAGVASTVRFAGRVTATSEASAASQQEGAIATSPPRPKHPRMGAVALVLGGATLGMVGYLTFQGLKVGFL